MKRIDCLKVLAGITRENDLVVTNLGNTPHEWQSVRPSRANLYGMNLGECTPVALGLALALPNRRVIALDGDGNLLLNLASLADTAYHNPANLRIIVFDNQAYESPGGMPTATAHGVDLVQHLLDPRSYLLAILTQLHSLTPESLDFLFAVFQLLAKAVHVAFRRGPGLVRRPQKRPAFRRARRS